MKSLPGLGVRLIRRAAVFDDEFDLVPKSAETRFDLALIETGEAVVNRIGHRFEEDEADALGPERIDLNGIFDAHNILIAVVESRMQRLGEG